VVRQRSCTLPLTPRLVTAGCINVASAEHAATPSAGCHPPHCRYQAPGQGSLSLREEPQEPSLLEGRSPWARSRYGFLQRKVTDLQGGQQAFQRRLDPRAAHSHPSQPEGDVEARWALAAGCKPMLRRSWHGHGKALVGQGDGRWASLHRQEREGLVS